ncbi:MAG: efflux RND transporter permease subunit, partial [Proteobacteria bacterium]|nr:efflux RND transporter permease subunit [Pseudomonadota bacterium]
REYAKRRIVIAMNVKDRDLGGFVTELQKKLDAQLKLPDGYYFVYGGQFENMQRALNHLALIVPVTILAIFFLLFILFNSVRYATMIITVLPFAAIGGVFGLAITGEYLSVPASVGFIALCGIAVLNGVVLITCIQHLRSEGLTQIEAIREGCKQRLRPVLMTATVALLALVPFLFATGVTVTEQFFVVPEVVPSVIVIPDAFMIAGKLEEGVMSEQLRTPSASVIVKGMTGVAGVPPAVASSLII